MDDEQTPPIPDEPSVTPPTPPAPPTPAAWGEPAAPSPAAWGEPVTPSPTPPKRRFGLVAAIVGLVVIGAIAIVVLTNGGGGSGLPDAFGGAERIDSGPMAELFSGMSDAFSQAGMEIDLAIYGGELLPRYMIMTVEGETVGADPLSSGLQQGLVSGMGGQIDMSQAIEETVDGVYYVCVPAANPQAGAGFGSEMGICLYQDGDRVAVAMSLTNDELHGLLDQTKELHSDLEG